MRKDRIEALPVRYRLVEVENGVRLDLSVALMIPETYLDREASELWANVQRVLTKAIYTRAQRKAASDERRPEPANGEDAHGEVRAG